MGLQGFGFRLRSPRAPQGQARLGALSRFTTMPGADASVNRSLSWIWVLVSGIWNLIWEFTTEDTERTENTYVRAPSIALAVGKGGKIPVAGWGIASIGSLHHGKSICIDR